MQCPQCGSEVSGRFCANCGAQVDGADGSSQTAAPVTPGTRATNPSDGVASDSANPTYPAVSSSPDAAETSAQSDSTAATSVHPLGDTGNTQTRSAVGEPPGSPAAVDENQPSTPTGGSSWAHELGVPDQKSFQRTNLVPVPPAVQEALAPLEQFGRQPVAWLGSALLVIGSFLNTKTADINYQLITASGSQTLWGQSQFWAIVVLLMALVSAALAYIWDFRWLWITGGVAFLALLAGFLDSFSGGGTGVSVHPSYGWILLFPGALLILAAAAMRGRQGEPSGDAMTYINNLRSRPQ